jgi:hypothetical protein
MKALRLLLAVLIVGATPQASALELIPASRHHLFQNFGNLNETGMAFLYESAAVTSGSAGETLPVLGFEKYGQFLLSFSYQGFQQLGGEGKFALTSSNGSFGFFHETDLSAGFRVQVGFVHAGGHLSDGTPYNGLYNLSAFYDRAIFRFFKDLEDQLRMTISIEPVTRSSPEFQWFMGEQSIEYFPTISEKLHPYLAVGLREMGLTGTQTSVSSNIQLGLANTSPFTKDHHTLARIAAGYYAGPDPSIKIFNYTGSSRNFAYLGFFFNF